MILERIIIKAFLFDLDGTIWDSENVIVDTLQNTISEEKNEIISKEMLLKELRVYHSPLKVLRQHEIWIHNSYWKKYRCNSEKIVLFYNNTFEIFDYLLKQKKFIGYITSLKKEFTLKLLKKFGLYEFPHVIITPSECRQTKPSPKPIIMALEKLIIRNSEAIYIGDQDTDIIAAKRAGCKSGLASWGAHNKIQEKSDYVFETMENILFFVKEKEVIK